MSADDARRGPRNEDEESLEASRAPLLEHLIELRQRLIYSMVALILCFAVCFYFAQEIFNLLLWPYERASGEEVKLIFTAPQEFFFTQMRLAMFGAAFLACPIVLSQIYMFVAPGLYKSEQRAFLPFLAATPILFVMGGALVYFVIMPLALNFFLSMQQAPDVTKGGAAIELLPRVSEYLSLVTTLILAFGLCFQLPVLLTLLGQVGIVSAAQLRKGRKYAIVIAFGVAAILTPPDLISQVGLGVPTILLYEISIFCVAMLERRRARERAERDAEE